MVVSGDFPGSGLGMGLEAFLGSSAFHENLRMEALRLKIAGLDWLMGLLCGILFEIG